MPSQERFVGPILTSFLSKILFQLHLHTCKFFISMKLFALLSRIRFKLAAMHSAHAQPCAMPPGTQTSCGTEAAACAQSAAGAGSASSWTDALLAVGELRAAARAFLGRDAQHSSAVAHAGALAQHIDSIQRAAAYSPLRCLLFFIFCASLILS